MRVMCDGSQSCLVSLWTSSLLFSPTLVIRPPHLLLLWCLGAASLCLMAADDADADVITASQHPRLACHSSAAIFPSVQTDWLTDWRTDRQTDRQTDVGRLEHPCIHPPVYPSGRGSSLLLLPPPASHSSPLIDAPLRQQPTQAPLLKPRRTPSLSLSLSTPSSSSLSGGFSMYGCATDRDAVGWRQEERKTGKKQSRLPRRSKKGASGGFLPFWMGRGFTLCGRRLWAAEVRNGSFEVCVCVCVCFFFAAQHRSRWVSHLGEDGACACCWFRGLLGKTRTLRQDWSMSTTVFKKNNQK